MAFKVGDKVRVVTQGEHEHNHYFLAGQLGVVAKVLTPGLYDVHAEPRIEGEPSSQFLLTDDIEAAP